MQPKQSDTVAQVVSISSQAQCMTTYWYLFYVLNSEMYRITASQDKNCWQKPTLFQPNVKSLNAVTSFLQVAGYPVETIAIVSSTNSLFSCNKSNSHSVVLTKLNGFVSLLIW